MADLYRYLSSEILGAEVNGKETGPISLQNGHQPSGPKLVCGQKTMASSSWTSTTTNDCSKVQASA